MRAFQKHENNPMHSSLQENSVARSMVIGSI